MMISFCKHCTKIGYIHVHATLNYPVGSERFIPVCYIEYTCLTKDYDLSI